MRTYPVGTTDLRVSRIAYGCAEIAPNNAPITAEIRATATKLIHTAREQGITLFDHAAMYGSGSVEAVFGDVLAESPGLREHIVIQTKCGAVLNPDRQRPGDAPFLFDCRREVLIASAEASLKRLRTDRVDILLVHWPDPLCNPEEIASAFDELHRAGKVLHFGVSNHTSSQLEILRRYVRQPLVVNQVRLGLAQSFPIAAGLEQLRDWSVPLPQGYSTFANIIDYCRLHGIQLQAYSPLRGIKRHQLINPPEDATAKVKEAAAVLRAVAQTKNTLPPAVALAWLLHHPANMVALIGGKNPQHIAENCVADRVELDRVEWYQLFYSACAVQAPA